MTALLSKIVWLLCAAGWFILRYPHQRRSGRTPIRESLRGGREGLLLLISLTGLGILPVVYIATGFPRFADYPFAPWQGWVGLVLFAASLWLFYRTHRDLGRNWSVSLDIRKDHSLVTRGVYTLVRHPMYSAFWLWAVAQAFLLPNWIAGPAGIVGFGTLFFGRVGREEEMMLATFGDEYRRYMKRTARIIPWLY